MKTIIPDFEYTADPHTLLDDADFSPLDRLYEGRSVVYGDFHAHSDSGGTSDGHTTPEEWLVYMDKLHIDFVGLMDHRQVRHQYLDCFDPARFLYGTEPAGGIAELNAYPHYLMIFPQRDCLERILERFPEYEFTGGVEGHFKYKKYTRSRFMEIVAAVLEEGGAFVHAHPRQVLRSENYYDYYFGEHTAIETIYAESGDSQLNEHTIDNYKLWREMLDAGLKVYNTATSDCHGEPKSTGINTLYVAERICAAYVDRLRAGDVNAGYIGIKMSIGDTPTGGDAAYAEDKALLLRADDVHPINYDPNEAYRVDIITDRGLAYSAPFTIGFKAALKLEPRKFYRAEIIRESDGAPAAIGNPIWVK